MGIRISSPPPTVIVSESIQYTEDWVRPADWLPMPTITPGEQKLAALFGVYENDYNQINIRFTNIDGYVDWGDGTAGTVTGVVTEEHLYDYASLTGSVYQDTDGKNYKQVIIIATGSGGTYSTVELARTSTYNSPGTRNILDFVFSWDGNTTFITSQAWDKCERFIYLAPNLGSNINGYYDYKLTNVRYLELPSGSSITSAQAAFRALGPVTNSPNIYINNTGTSNSMFQSLTAKKLGNITIDSSTALTSLFVSSYGLEVVGGVTGSACTNLATAFSTCYRLKSLGLIHTPNNTTISSTFNTCISLEEITFTDCSNVTTTTTAFNSCRALRSLRMPGIAVSFSIASCNLQRDALVALFGDLATTTATITITGNPGVPDLSAADLQIATDKGWTVAT